MKTLAQSNNFSIMLDDMKYQPAEIDYLEKTATTDFVTGFEDDYGQLCTWYGVNQGDGFGIANPVKVMLVNNSGGGESGAYSIGNSWMTLSTLGCNWATGGNDAGKKAIRATFVHEMNHIMESYRNTSKPGVQMPWNDSTGEGLSRVAANMLHPNESTDNVNAWLACNPIRDYTSAVEDSEFRKNWVAQNFNGGTYRTGGQVKPCGDAYSFGCAILFINYLRDQLGYPMTEIVQHCNGTLEQTYHLLTEQDLSGFLQFRRLLDVHFPGLNIYYKGSNPDNPFPLDFTNVPFASAGRSNNLFVLARMLDGRVVYNQKAPDKPFVGWQEVPGDVRTDVQLATGMLGKTLFVFAKRTDGKIIFNQAAPGGPFVGWQNMPGDIVTDVPLAVAGRSDNLFVFAKKLDGSIVYSHAAPGQAFQNWQAIPVSVRTTDAVAAGMLNNTLFVFVRQADGKIIFNQAAPGGIFVGWQFMPEAVLTDVPPAVTGWEGNIFVFVRNRENAGIYFTQAAPGAAFAPWQEVPGSHHTDISLGAGMQGNRLFVFANQQKDGRVYYNQMLAGHDFSGWRLML